MDRMAQGVIASIGKRPGARVVRAAVLLGVAALAWAGFVGCASGGEDQRPPTPIAWVTPPPPATLEGLEKFSPECDAAMIRAARGEAELSGTLASCGTLWEWLGAARRYSAALPRDQDGQSFLVDLCFRAPTELFLRSGPCLQTVGGRTGPLAIYGGRNDGDALLIGTLVLQGQCLFIIDPVGESPAPSGRPVLLAFSIGTGWDAKNQAVTYEGGELRVGEVVQVHGSAARKDAAGSEWLVPPHPTCESDVIWYVGSAPQSR
ncbi:hypothetical protein [Tepidiforma sp.]|uniref:hypothetical protein n=1 Tax=Tepidiforma sp. TaxID=2682230 RepID=UPI002ADE249E|nr:hypothetical protein [Tepidiforma sp.]